MFAQVDDNALIEELEQYHKGYMHAIDDVRKVKLRSRDVVVNKGGLNPNQPSSNQTSPKKRNEKQKEPIASKEVGKGTDNVKEPKQTVHVELGKLSSMFNL